jgi:hypothetical protein
MDVAITTRAFPLVAAAAVKNYVVLLLLLQVSMSASRRIVSSSRRSGGAEFGAEELSWEREVGKASMGVGDGGSSRKNRP